MEVPTLPMAKDVNYLARNELHLFCRTHELELGR